MTNAHKHLMEVLKAHGYAVTPQLEARLGYLLAYASRSWMPVDVDPVLKWLEGHRRRCGMTIEEVPMSQVERWSADPATGVISHDTGEFFSVIGVRVTNAQLREASSWCQPMIHQKEMGILGILVQLQDGEDRYLLQAKAEPGNVERVQISPTLQSTVSNLRRAHGGSKSRFAEYFESPRPGSVIYSRHQMEDGGRFYLKTNLNMLVRLPDGAALEVPEDFMWVTMGQIKELLQYANLVNIAVRSIISAIW